MEEERQRQSYAKGFNQEMARFRIDAILPWVRGGTLLDVGCGEGDVTVGLQEAFTKVIGIDLSQEYLAEATRLLGDHAELHHSSVEDFDCPHPVDFALAVDILEHVADPVAVLQRIGTWLGEKGRLCTIVPNATSLHRRIGVEMSLIADCYELGPQDHEVGHRRYYDMDTLTADLRAAGFRPIHQGGILLKPFANSQMLELPTDYVDALARVAGEIPRYCAELFIISECR